MSDGGGLLDPGSGPILRVHPALNAVPADGNPPPARRHRRGCRLFPEAQLWRDATWAEMDRLRPCRECAG